MVCEIQQVYATFDEVVYVCWAHKKVHVINTAETPIPEGFEFKKCEDFERFRSVVKGSCLKCFGPVLDPVVVGTGSFELLFCSEGCRNEYLSKCHYCGKIIESPIFDGYSVYCSEECAEKAAIESDLSFFGS